MNKKQTQKQKAINKMITKNVTSSSSPYITYGKVLKIPFLLIMVMIICLITPFTNWIIPLIYNKIKKKLVLKMVVSNI